MKDINDYISYLRILKYSELTIISYKVILNNFYIRFKEKYLRLTYQDFNIYIKELEKKYSNSTLNLYITVLKGFYSYLGIRKKVDRVEVKLMTGYKVTKRMNVIGKKDIELLLNISNYEDTYFGIRNLLIMELLFSTGIRVNELVNLKISDIDIYHHRILVLGKGKRERYVLFGSVCKNILIKYFLYRTSYLKDKNCKYLLLNNRKNKISTNGIRFIIDGIAKRLGIQKHLHPHLFRHTIASVLHENGAETGFIQQFLGHEKMETTGRYIYTNYRNISNTYVNSHPRAKMRER